MKDVYRVFAYKLEAVRPEVIVTQSQCEVCAVSLSDVEDAVCRMVSSQPRIVSLEPNDLVGVFRDIRRKRVFIVPIRMRFNGI
jgi:iron complex transport system substrate-binding protein